MRSPSLDFYQYDGCQQILDAPVFWLVEKGSSTPIVISMSAQEGNSTPVINTNEREVLVLPIDKNVPLKKKNNAKDEESLCDVLIETHHSQDLIIFAELKKSATSPVKKAAEQLMITIDAYRESHPAKLQSFTKRYAYITHRSDHRLYVSHKDLSRKFRTLHHFRLYMEKEITIS